MSDYVLYMNTYLCQYFRRKMFLLVDGHHFSASMGLLFVYGPAFCIYINIYIYIYIYMLVGVHSLLQIAHLLFV